MKKIGNKKPLKAQVLPYYENVVLNSSIITLNRQFPEPWLPYSSVTVETRNRYDALSDTRKKMNDNTTIEDSDVKDRQQKTEKG